MVFHNKMVLAFRYGDDDERRCWWWDWRFWKPFPQQNGFGISVRWWWWTTVLMMRLKILETISTSKWFWSTTHRNHFHSKMVLAFRYGDDDGDDDERRCWWWDWRFRVWFVLFGFIWGCRKQLCWDLCTMHKDFLMHHNRTLFQRV